jgi:hypothetical protein
MELNGWGRCRREIGILIFENLAHPDSRTYPHPTLYALSRAMSTKTTCRAYKYPEPAPSIRAATHIAPRGDPHREGRWTTCPGSG